MPPSPRTIGRYAIIDPLGHGGMGVVYRAWDPELRRQVAIKVISGGGSLVADPGTPDAPMVNDDLFERFAREAQAAASLAHPNIVTIFDFGRHASRPFIVMELVDGETMAHAIQSGSAMTLARRVQLAIDLCEGLGYAHEQGIVHRDVKPANLVISAAGPLKILDFGIARLTDELASRPLTHAGGLIGTPQYMSPEQVSGAPVDARSDIFAVGTVLYELFTGRVAFSAPTPALVPAMVLQQTPPAIHELVPGFPEVLERVVTQAMHKDPSRRFQRLDEIAVRLREWLETAADEAAPADDVNGEGAEAGSKDAPVDRAELSGLLAQWEDAVGELLDTPVPVDDEPDPVVVAPPAPVAVKTPSSAKASAATPVASKPAAAKPAAVRPAAANPGATHRRSASRAWLALAATVVLAGGGALWLAGRSAPPASPGASSPATPTASSPPAPPASSPTPPAASSGVPSAAAPPSSTSAPASVPAPVPAAGQSTAPAASSTVAAPETSAPPANAAATSDTLRTPARPPRSNPGPLPSGAAAPARPPSAEDRAKCQEIVQRVTLGEELTPRDREFLNRNCRDRSP